MTVDQVFLLVGSGLAAGFLAGLLGVGGGIIFAPVLFFYFQSLPVAPGVLAPLVIGTSLFCTVVSAVSSAWFQYHKGAVYVRIALTVGLFSTVATVLITRFVTTRPWFSPDVFQMVFSVVMVIVVGRMLTSAPVLERKLEPAAPTPSVSVPVLAVAGTATGIFAAGSGVGGGVVLVPVYSRWLRFPFHAAVGTSSATIIVSSLLGVFTYMVMGLGQSVPATAIGYVDIGHALVLALPSVLTARLGVWTAHRIPVRVLQWCFALIALIVIFRMLQNVW